jgi:hypothetical protein
MKFINANTCTWKHAIGEDGPKPDPDPEERERYWEFRK